MSDLGPLPEPAMRSGPGSMTRRDYFTAEQMRAYADAAVVAERERCAKLVETQDPNGDYGVRSWFELLAAKIRA